MIPLIQRVPAHIRVFQSRAAYREAFGVEAPPFDFSQPVKDWLDTRKSIDPEAEISYRGIRYLPNGEPDYNDQRVVTLAEFRLFTEVAQSVNLLPEPVPALGSLTPNQARMISRRRAWPLELKDGERVILAPGIGTIPVVDDGSRKPATGGCCGSCDEALTILRRIEGRLK